MTEIKIAQTKDATAIYQHLITVSSETNNLSFSSKDVHQYLNETDISARVEDTDNAAFFAAFDGDKIIGLAQLSRRAIPRYLNRGDLAVSVQQDYWQAGVGSRLVERVIEHATYNWQLHGIYLNVLSGNLRAINLYKKYGFKIVGDLPLLMTISGKDVSGKLMFNQLSN